jgi:hypothetical protein
VLELDRHSSANDSVITLERSKDRTGETLAQLELRFVDRRDDSGHTIAVVPTLHGKTLGEPAARGPKAPINVDDRIATMLALLPCTTQELYKGMPGGRNDTVKLRMKLVHDGRVVQKDGLWCEVIS